MRWVLNYRANPGALSGFDPVFSTKVSFMKRLNFLTQPLALVFVAVFATSVFAQEERGGRGRGGFGGPGGGRPGGFGGDPIIGLLAVEPVREEIEMMPDQVEALTKLREQSTSGRDGNFDFRSASEEERTKFFADLQKRQKELREKLDEVLLPEQLERLEEISLQTRGTMALMDPEIAAKLNITEEQKAKFEEIRNKSGERMREVFGSGDRDKMREEMAKVRKESDDASLAVLTAEQRKQFDEMKGEPFEMPEGTFGGFGGGRGGFGGPGGGPGGPGGGGRPGGDGGSRRRPPAE